MIIENKRDCGTCTLCCLFPEIAEYNSPINEYCKNCVPNKGCLIYNNRPHECSSFSCLWQQQPQVPESLRPDKCGIMFELPYGCSTYIGYVVPEKPEAWKHNNVRLLISKINDAGDNVIIKHVDGNKSYVLAEGKTKEDANNDINNFLRSLMYHISSGGI
jgi:hypothetical protein